MSNWNKNSGYGQSLINFARNVCPTFGNVLVVMVNANSDEANYHHMAEVYTPDPDGQIRFYNTLEAAYAAAESNNNDIILLDGNSSHVVAEEISWSKNRIHVVGMDGGGRLHGQGAKVQNTDGTAAVSVIHVSGTRNTFENIKFIQVDDDGTSQNVVKESGESTLYKNCSFIFGNVAELDETDSYEVMLSGDSTEFHNCTFGADTLVTSGARAVTAFDVITTAAKSNVFKDCVWNIMSSTADANFVRVVATTDLHFGHLFINPIFLATISDSLSAITLTDAVDSVSGLNAGNMLMINPATNCTNLSSTASDNLKVVGPGMLAHNAASAVSPTAYLGIGITPA